MFKIVRKFEIANIVRSMIPFYCIGDYIMKNFFFSLVALLEEFMQELRGKLSEELRGGIIQFIENEMQD